MAARVRGGILQPGPPANSFVQHIDGDRAQVRFERINTRGEVFEALRCDYRIIDGPFIAEVWVKPS